MENTIKGSEVREEIEQAMNCGGAILSHTDTLLFVIDPSMEDEVTRQIVSYNTESSEASPTVLLFMSPITLANLRDHLGNGLVEVLKNLKALQKDYCTTKEEKA